MSPQSVVRGDAMLDMGLRDKQARDLAAFLDHVDRLRFAPASGSSR